MLKGVPDSEGSCLEHWLGLGAKLLRKQSIAGPWELFGISWGATLLPAQHQSHVAHMLCTAGGWPTTQEQGPWPGLPHSLIEAWPGPVKQLTTPSLCGRSVLAFLLHHLC